VESVALVGCSNFLQGATGLTRFRRGGWFAKRTTSLLIVESERLSLWSSLMALWLKHLEAETLLKTCIGSLECRSWHFCTA
jgi:hypothetical protein